MPAHAGPNEQAKRIYERIAGVPPPPAVLTQMAALISPPVPRAAPPTRRARPNAALIAAAQVATQAADFYNVTLKNLVIPWTNRDQTVFAPFNDYAATVIGMVRDDVPFNTALSADILYTVNSPGLPPPSNASNSHYATAEANGVDLSTTLKQTTQSATYGTPTAATAGLLTTYAAESAFFIKGTNRAMFRFTMINHFCNDMPTLDGHHAAHRPHPPGRGALAGWGQPRVPQHLRRLPQRHGPDGAGVRVLQLQRHRRPRRHEHRHDAVHARAGAAEVSDQRGQLPVRLRDPGRQLVEPLAQRHQCLPRLERLAPGQRQRRQVTGSGARVEPRPSPSAR